MTFFLIYNFRKQKICFSILFMNEKTILIKIILKNKWFDYESSELEVSEEDYELIIEKSKNFYETSFEMWINDRFVIFPPDLTRESILEIKIIS